MYVLIGGPDRGLADAFETLGVDVARIEGVITRDDLDREGIVDVDVFVLTDVGEASAVPVAKHRNRDVRVVVYDESTMPEFVRAQVDLAVDPKLLDPTTVAEELVG
jgi:hypothetical protein